MYINIYMLFQALLDLLRVHYSAMEQRQTYSKDSKRPRVIKPIITLKLHVNIIQHLMEKFPKYQLVTNATTASNDRVNKNPSQFWLKFGLRLKRSHKHHTYHK